MFERFTERARQVVVLAQAEALGLKHNQIDTEHLLLGLLREQEGLAGRVLASFDLNVERVREQVVRIVGLGEQEPPVQIPITPRAKKVLELGLRESRSLGNTYVGTEHLLLGLVREGEGLAVRILRDLDADPKEIRNQVIRMLPATAPRPPRPTRDSPQPLQWIAPGWIDGLGLILNQLADEIRRDLGREPDAGDLLLVLAAAPDAVAAQALAHLNVDVDELRGQIEQLRGQARAAGQRLDDQIKQARLEKQRAIESQEFQAAARYRDQERRLTQQRRKVVPTETLQAIRHRLGLRPPGDRPTATGS